MIHRMSKNQGTVTNNYQIYKHRNKDRQRPSSNKAGKHCRKLKRMYRSMMISIWR